MLPGEYILDDRDIEINAGREKFEFFLCEN